MKDIVKLNVNGEDSEILASHYSTLLEVLREDLGLTGVKEACDGTGECGSCTVLIDSEPKLACLLLAIDCEGKKITTIEGLAEENELTTLQKSFVDYGAVQCGFCTPGMILSATALLNGNPNPSTFEIQKAIEGNLCRCTGYNKIIEAVRKTAEKTL